MRRLLALAIVAAASHPSASPKSAPSWSAASGARLAAWVARAANCSFDARRVALLVAVHPPKFEEAFALLKSSIAAAAGGDHRARAQRMIEQRSLFGGGPAARRFATLGSRGRRELGPTTKPSFAKRGQRGRDGLPRRGCLSRSVGCVRRALPPSSLASLKDDGL